MKSEIVYMLGVIGAGFAVNYLLRALPFLLFAGRDRELPPWVSRLGRILSPVIIVCLVAYSFSGLAWKTAWPYLAGALTVGLQLWRRNPLVSIVAGTVLYMCLLTCGCASIREVSVDARDPTVVVRTTGVYLGDMRIEPQDVPGYLSDAGIPRDRTIHVRLDGGVRDLRTARAVLGFLAKAGYQCPVLVTKQHGDSFSTNRPPRTGARGSVTTGSRKARPAVRYKGANE